MSEVQSIFNKTKNKKKQPDEDNLENLIQIVSFSVGDETFGLDILNIQEIIRITEITRVPNSEDYVKGVINLRGKIIPIIDLRKRISMPSKEYDTDTRIIVIEFEDMVAGSGVYKLPDNMIILLDIKNVLKK